MQPNRLSTPRVALFGPIQPFRGGIAKYTLRLHTALSKRCDLTTISFHRQYPAWLYPGASDREPGQEGYQHPRVRYMLDALNPLTWRRAAYLIRGQGCDLAILSWWTLFWAPGFALIAWLLRRHQIPVALLCHNLSDHDSGRLQRWLTRHFLAQADAFIVHTSEQEAILLELFPSKKVIRHPHPVYNQFPEASTTLPQRGRLELLFFGFIRPYKGLDLLVQALAEVADKEVFLTVVGEPWIDPETLRTRMLSLGAPNIELHFEYVDDVSAANYFKRADVVVLPYLTATGSGVAALAQNYERPLLVTAVGGLKDVVENGVTGHVVEPNSVNQIAKCIRQMDRTTLQSMHTNIRRANLQFSWDSMASSILSIIDADRTSQTHGKNGQHHVL
jgi:glycosyltransferase involved in cell wall biosynthesis